MVTTLLTLRSSQFALRLVSGEWEGVDDGTVTPASGQTHRGWITNHTPDSRYTVDMTNGTVIDTETGLMWQRCAQGLTGNNCTGIATPLNWQGALALADSSEFASHSDWRLPNIVELRSLVAYDRHGPAINATTFPTATGTYWSSSPSSANGDEALALNFANGSHNYPGAHLEHFSISAAGT